MVHDFFQCMDFGFHQSLTRAVMMHVSAMDQQRRSLQTQSDQVNKSLGALDSRLDKQRFIGKEIASKATWHIWPRDDIASSTTWYFCVRSHVFIRFPEYNNTTFMIPKKFEYNPVRRDESEMVDQKPILDELMARKASLYER